MQNPNPESYFLKHLQFILLPPPPLSLSLPFPSLPTLLEFFCRILQLIEKKLIEAQVIILNTFVALHSEFSEAIASMTVNSAVITLIPE